MKKVLVILLTLAMVLFLFAGCASNDSATKDDSAKTDDSATAEDSAKKDSSDITICYSAGDLNIVFDNLLYKAAEEKCQELGVNFTGTDAQADNMMQIDQINAAIQKGVDGIVVNLVTTDAEPAITKACNDANIPVVYCNMYPWGNADIPEGSYYVGSREEDAGRFQAEYLSELIGDQEVGVCILEGVLGSSGALGRTNGNHEILDTMENVTILDEQTGDWLRDEGLTMTQNWLTAYGDELNVILANNDEMALGAWNACKEAGRTDIIIMGVDANADGLASVKAGEMKATVLQDADNQAGTAIDQCFKLITEGEAETVIWVPFVLINDTNIEEYL